MHWSNVSPSAKGLNSLPGAAIAEDILEGDAHDLQVLHPVLWTHTQVAVCYSYMFSF